MQRVREDALYDAFRELARSLILLLDDADSHSRLDIGSILTVHFDI